MLLLFFGGESQNYHRLVKDIWDAGDLVLFGLISFTYFRHKPQTLASRIMLTTVFCLVVGSAVEFLQLLFHATSPATT